MYTKPTVADFKAFFVRDFPYGVDPSVVMDSDITNALAEAGFNFNEGLFDSQADYQLAYLLLTAHYLVMDLRASSQGIAGQYSFLVSGRAVGNVSESFSIPQAILDNPMFSFYTKTPYGAKYLNLIYPLLSGQIFAVCRRTNP